MRTDRLFKSLFWAALLIGAVGEAGLCVFMITRKTPIEGLALCYQKCRNNGGVSMFEVSITDGARVDRCECVGMGAVDDEQ